MNCTKCGQKITTGLQKYHRTKKGAHHRECPPLVVENLVQAQEFSQEQYDRDERFKHKGRVNCLADQLHDLVEKIRQEIN